MSALRDLEVEPLGRRWPWYPRYVAKVTISNQRVSGGELHLDLVASDWAKKRVGLRRWWRHVLAGPARTEP